MAKKPKLGQHFLINPTAREAVVRALGNVANAAVLEIGPGRGALTDLLASCARRLIAVEYDRELASALARRYAENDRVEVIAADILSLPLTDVAALAGGPLRVVGNLPYYITSDILLHLFAHAGAIELAVLMTQREVAERVTATPGGRDYGLLSATAQLYAQVDPLFELAPEDFCPPPEVHSAVFRLTMAPRFNELGVEPAPFLAFLRQCFAQKRKTLANNLRVAGYPAAAVSKAIAACGIDGQPRAEAIPLHVMACLFQRLRAELDVAVT